MKVLSFILIIISFNFISCKLKLLNNTNIENTKFDQRVVKFFNFYAIALENRSIDKIMKLISKDYLEKITYKKDSRNINYDELKIQLIKTFKHIKKMKISFHIQNIKEMQDYIDVNYSFSEQAIVRTGIKEKLIFIDSASRIRLCIKKYSFKILSGF